MAQMERLVQDLLCLAKAEQAELGFAFAPVDLRTAGIWGLSWDGRAEGDFPVVC